MNAAITLTGSPSQLLVLVLLLIAIAVLGRALVRSNRALRKREEERGAVYIEETVPAFEWPARPPKEAVAKFTADHATRTRVGL